MRTWSLTTGSPLSLRLAADARLCVPDYVDDQIWEVMLEGGEPPALGARTSYGLRARSMRLFPSFLLEGQHACDPSAFAAPPIVRQFFPNYLKVEFSPFADLPVQAEYWVPDSHSLASRLLLHNPGAEARHVRVEIHAALRHAEPGTALKAATHAGATVLAGQTAGLAPVVFVSGGAVFLEQAAEPALAVACDLPPGGARSVVWAHCGLGEEVASFEAARAVAARSWDSEIARIELLNHSLVDIETGEPDWDAAFMLAQKVALSGYVGPTRMLPHASFVLARTPDHGFSQRGDGRDYTLHWDGQTPSLAYLSARQILPAAPELAKGVVVNLLSGRGIEGQLDNKPGLGGQRSGWLAMPLIATLAWRIFEQTEDRDFLGACFDPLLEHVENWFSAAHDRDQDGHPEWDHTPHAGFDDWPSFVRWQPWGQGLDLTKAETPDLAAYLARECRSLLLAAEVLGRTDATEVLGERWARLREAVESSWSDVTSSYHHRDREAHASPAGEFLGGGQGSFTLEVGRAFDPPARVLIRSTGEQGLSHAVTASIEGRGPRGAHRVERMTEHQFQWFWQLGTATSDRLFSEIDAIQVSGLSDAFTTEIWTADFTRQDCSLLLPLWGGIPEAERARRLVRITLTDPRRYWRPNGIPACSAQDPAYRPDQRGGAGGIWMFWNTLLGEGLVEYGFLKEAAELVNRLMQGPIHALKSDRAFREAYDSDRSGGIGEPDHLAGLAPTPLFLDVLGVRLVSPWKVRISGRNPFPWLVTVRWMGLEVRREPGAHAAITFPNGVTSVIEDEQPCWVEIPQAGSKAPTL